MRIPHGNYRGLIVLVVAVVLAVSGIISFARGLSDQRSVANTQNLGNIPAANTTNRQAGRFLSFAQPTSITIPSVNITSTIATVGMTAGGSIDTPKGEDFDRAAWYTQSPAPGQYGASVIVGHVDSYQSGNSASVFYNLSRLKPGALVDIERSDQTIATFKVYALRQYGRQAVPASQVYRPHTNDAELRLITCSGSFDTKTGEYSDNTIVFASLVNSRPGS